MKKPYFNTLHICIARLSGGPVSPWELQLQERQDWLRPPLGEPRRGEGGEDFNQHNRLDNLLTLCKAMNINTY